MPTFLLERDKRRINSKKSSQGFTLLEIMVALMIVSLLLYVSISGSGPSSRNDLDRAMDILEKVINYSINESILRNRITRTHFDLTDEAPQIKIEFSSDNTFVLPGVKEYDDKDLSIKEKEAKQKLVKKINSNFKAVDDVDPDSLRIPEQVQILGIATSLRSSFITDEETSIYVYPTGERDRALIIFAAFEELAALTIEPYTGEFKRQYVTVKVSNKLEKEYEAAVEKLLVKWVQ